MKVVSKKRGCKPMPSKREKRKWRKYVESEAILLDVHVRKLMYDELRFEARMRNKSLRLARKRRTDYII